nr:hypothetical protein [Tanacetum cinerariifolium]
MFDEYFNPPPSDVSPVPVAAAPRVVNIASVEEPIPNALFDDPCHKPLHDVSTLQESSSIVQSSYSPLKLIGKWTKDHPLANVIGNPSRPISDLTQDILVGSAYKMLKGTCRSYVKLEYNMEECYKAPTDQLDWNNLEGDRYPFDLSKPLHLVKSRNCQIVPVDYFFNNDLAYLQGESTDKTYTTFLTKTKVAKYDLPGIKDTIPNLWSPIKVAYDKHVLLGEDIVHLAAVLRRFTRRIVIQKRVEDLQLGVESYQRKLNISKPRIHDEDLSRITPYTTLSNPKGVIYEDKLNRKRLMRSNEL